MNHDIKRQDDFVLWQQFVTIVQAHIDPVLSSILLVTELVQFDRIKKIVEVTTLKKFVLFQDLFFEQKYIYQEYLNKIFGYQVTLILHFSKQEVKVYKQYCLEQEETKQALVNNNTLRHSIQKENQGTKKGKMLDVSDKNKWVITHSLLSHFGGIVQEIIKETDAFDA